MKYLVKILCLIGVTGMISGCQSNKPLNQLPNFDFKAWKHEILYQFDSLASANNQFFIKYIATIVPKSLRFEINRIGEQQFMKAFNTVLKKNKIKKWDRLYVIINYLSGESNKSLISFIFVRQNKYWGIIYGFDSNKFYKMHYFNEKDIEGMHSLIHAYDDLVIISKFDNQYYNKKNEILIGVPFDDFEPVLDMYKGNNF